MNTRWSNGVMEWWGDGSPRGSSRFTFHVFRFSHSRSAFTLVELLAVIAIIGMLAGLVLYLGPTINDARKRKLVHAQMEQLTTVIEHYNVNKGFYPPDNPRNTPNNAYMTSLYYELIANAGTGVNLDANFGVGGIINSSSTSTGWKNFFPNIRPNQYREIDGVGGKVYVLGVTVTAPAGSPLKDFSFWHYRVAPQTNDPSIHNPQGFDLWVNVEMNKGPTTFGNWKESE